MMLSKHAKVRMQQRGFNKNDVNFIVDYGSEKIVHGASVYKVTKRIAKKMRSHGISPKIIERCKSSYVVISNGKVITVAHIH